MNDILSFYQQQLHNEQALAKKLAKKDFQFSLLRLLVFVLAVAVFVVLLPSYSLFAWLALAVGLAAFLVLVKTHLRVEKRHKFVVRKIETIQREIDCQHFDFAKYADGANFEPKEHDYASDLDLFGPYSLFQYVNRAATYFGKHTLAQWFLRHAQADELAKRQQAVQELSDKYTFRMNYLCELQGLDNELIPRLKTWANQADTALPFFYRFYVWVYVPLVFSSLVASFYLPFMWNVSVILFAFNFMFHVAKSRFFAAEHAKVSKTGSLLVLLRSALLLVEQEGFQSDKLRDLQARLKQGKKLTAAIKQLAGYIASWDYRLNIIVYFFLASLFAWDLHWLLRIRNWKTKHRETIVLALDVLAEFEALVSLGNLRFNHPSWTFPEIRQEQNPVFEELGHPLIKPAKCVTNDFSFRLPNELIFVSGSNMAGKSTFLRSVGVNLVLAQMGAPVCAKRMVFSPVELFSIMRIKDSLEEDTSTFYFEIKRIKKLLNRVANSPKVFYLLDELLRGTNSHDKHFGTKALIEWLLKREGRGFIASHDLGLADLEKELDAFSNYHFDVQIDGNKMDFDYKLKQGACKTFNASLLLREIGIVVEEEANG